MSGPLSAEVRTTMSRPSVSTQALKLPSGRNSRKADVYINVDRSQEYSISGTADEGTSLDSYMSLPAHLYIQTLFPSTSKLECVEGNKYQIVVPPLKFFDWEVNPVTYSRIWQTDSAVIIESNESTLVGTPLIESLNGQYYFQIRTELSWKARSIMARSQVEMWVNPILPFSLIPPPIAENGGNAVFQFVLDALHREFLKALGNDINKFLTSKTYRQEWKAKAEADAISSSPPQLLAQTSLNTTCILAMTLIGFFAASGVVLSTLQGLRGTIAKKFTEAREPLLTTSC